MSKNLIGQYTVGSGIDLFLPKPDQRVRGVSISTGYVIVRIPKRPKGRNNKRK